MAKKRKQPPAHFDETDLALMRKMANGDAMLTGDHALKDAGRGKDTVPVDAAFLDQVARTARGAALANRELDGRIAKLRMERPEAYEDMCCYIVAKLLDHALEGGSYRWLLYHRLALTGRAYARMQFAGALDLCNILWRTTHPDAERDMVEGDL